MLLTKGLEALILALAAIPVTDASTISKKRSSTPFVPGGKKAGSAGGNAVQFWEPHLGWWYDWTPRPNPKHAGVTAVSMLWGGGNNGEQDARRFKEFEDLKTQPKYILGFNEPDCSGPDVSAHMTVGDGVRLWNKLIAPYGQKGSHLGSPAMCKQKDETWLKKFANHHLDKDWDFTAVHIYKKDMGGVQDDIDYYWNTYKKPIWVTEFACVDDQNGFKACDDQNEVNKWIADVVDLFEKNDHVSAYAYTDGGGLGSVWPPVTKDGSALSESGKSYLSAIKKYSN